MDNKESIKSRLLVKMVAQLDEKLKQTADAKASITESKNAETKSSAGDKYETGRAMMQMEQDKIDWQQAQLQQLKNVLLQIDKTAHHDQIKLGSVVYSDRGNYFLSIGVGKIILDDLKFYAISLDSPLGKVLQSKSAGWKGIFLDKPIEISEVN